MSIKLHPLNMCDFVTVCTCACACVYDLKQVPRAGLGSITIVIVIDCNRLQLERNCNRNQIFLDSCVIVID